MQLEFVIGVTGHRDLLPEQIQNYRQQTYDFLHQMLWDYPLVTFRIISGMAEGADALVAELVLELAQQHENIVLTPVLPMPKTDYQQDFSPEGLQRFEHHCQQVEQKKWTVLTLPAQAERDNCYVNFSHYLANKSDLLLTLWNGNPNAEKGGTAYTLKMTQDLHFRSQCLKDIEYFDISEADELKGHILDQEHTPVYWLPVGRQKEPGSEHPSQGGYFYGAEQPLQPSDPGVSERLEQLSKMQEDIDKYAHKTSYQPCEQSLAKPSADDHRIRQYFSAFDSIANERQKQVKSAYTTTVTLTFLVSTLFLLYAKLVPSLYVLFAYLLAFAGGFVWFIANKPNNKKDKYAFYRALAESLRIEYLYYSCGLLKAQGYGSISGSIHNPGSGNISLIRQIIRQSWLSGSSALSLAIQPIPKALLEEQRDYFVEARHKLHVQHERIERVVKITIALPILLLISFFYPDLYQYYQSANLLTVNIKTWLVFSCALLPILGAVIELYAHYNSINELQNQYSKQINMLNNALQHLEQEQDTHMQQDVYRIVGKLMSSEHLMWLKTTSEKQLTTAHGG